MALRRSAGKLASTLPLFLPRSGASLHSHATSFGFKEVREEEKGQLVGNVFTSVASNYDLMNDLMSAGLHRLWKDRLVSKLHPFPGMKHLDVAGGTGDVAFRVLESINSVSRRALEDGLAEIEEETKIYVCDINPNMLNVGKKRAAEKGLGEDRCLCWVEGDAEALSFGDGSMDGYTIAFGIRNVTHIEKALTEAYRVLKRGGRFLCLELSHVEFPGFKQLYDYYSFSVIPTLGELIAGDRESYQYLVESIRQFPKQMWNAPICNLSEELLSKFGGGMGGYGESTSDWEFGFKRSEFGHGSLVGTVQMYDRHIFLCYKMPSVWPPQAETVKFDRLPKLLSAGIKARKGDLKKRAHFTLCEGEDSTQGDVLIFPDMIRYKRLTEYDVDSFVEKVLVKDTEWPSGEVETLSGSHIFVCAHGSRDQRCGVCGPVLVNRFKEEIHSRGLQGRVSVRACSHVGGHKYAGNVIIFGPNNEGEVTGHWYGYIAPDNVPTLFEQHIGKGKIIEHLWRGQMGLSKEDQRKVQDERLQFNGVKEGKSADEPNASN